MKCTTPMYFVTKKKLTSKVIPIMPAKKCKWEDYLLQITDTTLSSLLEEERSLYDTEQSKHLRKCNQEVVELYFKKLKNILSNASMTQEEISKDLVPCTSPIITLLRSGLKKTK